MKRLTTVWACLMVMTVMHAQDTQMLRDSLRAATELMEYYPDSVDLRLRKAALNMQLEQWEYAKEEYDRVILQHPQNLAAYYYRAYANERLYRYRFARYDYEQVLAVVPTHFEARLGLAMLNYKDKRYQESMDQMNVLVQQHPDSAVVYAIRAGMEKEQGMYAPAEYDYTQAIRLEPANTDYILSRADVRLVMGNKVEAREDLDRLVALGMSRASLSDYYQRIKKRKGKK